MKDSDRMVVPTRQLIAPCGFSLDECDIDPH